MIYYYYEIFIIPDKATFVFSAAIFAIFDFYYLFPHA